MKVQAIKCPDCKDTVYSRANHDCRSCSCFSNEVGGTGVFIDGGPNGEYIRYGWSRGKPELFELEVDATAQILHDDWNKGKDFFGLIKGRGYIDVYINKFIGQIGIGVFIADIDVFFLETDDRYVYLDDNWLKDWDYIGKL